MEASDEGGPFLDVGEPFIPFALLVMSPSFTYLSTSEFSRLFMTRMLPQDGEITSEEGLSSKENEALREMQQAGTSKAGTTSKTFRGTLAGKHVQKVWKSHWIIPSMSERGSCAVLHAYHNAYGLVMRHGRCFRVNLHLKVLSHSTDAISPSSHSTVTSHLTGSGYGGSRLGLQPASQSHCRVQSSAPLQQARTEDSHSSTIMLSPSLYNASFALCTLQHRLLSSVSDCD